MGLTPWLDERDILGGRVWQEVLERTVSQVYSAAVFLGPGGVGPWQKAEIRALLRRFVEKGKLLIPVILPGVEGEPEMPDLLRDLQRIDFRRPDSDPMDRLIRAITTVRPPVRLVRERMRLQYELAEAAGRKRFRWRPELDITGLVDAEHRALLEGPWVFAEGLEEFKARVVQAARPSTPPPPSPEGLFVFVNAEESDLPLPEAVEEALRQKQIDYAMPAWGGGTPEEIRKDTEKNLLRCDTFIVVWSNNLIWVRSQLDESRRIKALRDKPLEVIGVYEAPPKEKPNLHYRLSNIRVINMNCREGFVEPEFTRFLDALQRRVIA